MQFWLFNMNAWVFICHLFILSQKQKGTNAEWMCVQHILYCHE